MVFSHQSFPESVAKFLTKTLEQEDQSRRASSTVRVNTGRDQLQTPFSSCSSSSSLISSVIPLFYSQSFRIAFLEHLVHALIVLLTYLFYSIYSFYFACLQ